MLDDTAALGPAPLGVGFAGAGPVVQAIHLPTLARLPALFVARHVMDVEHDLAKSVAQTPRAVASTAIEELLADENVDVVVIGSPPRFHAEQTLAAIRAGKQAVLCEKPFATTRQEAEEVARASREAGVPVVVGAMHAFDPAWREVRGRSQLGVGDSRMIRSRIILPPNSVFEDQAADVIRPESAAAGPAARVSEVMRGAVLGLAIHDLPLIREFLPDWSHARVVAAELLDPWGYQIDLRCESTLIQLIGRMGAPSEADWTLSIIGDRSDLRVVFPPSYVHAGSAVVASRRIGEQVAVGPFPDDGYLEEWRHLHRLATGPGQADGELDALVDDLDFALNIADEAAALVEQEARS